MQDITSYIQQQIAAAQAEDARLEEEYRLKVAREEAKRKAKSVENTIKAMSHYGIKVTEEDLKYDEYYHSHLQYNNVRIYLAIEKGVNVYNEGYKRPFSVVISHVIPDKYRDEDGDLGWGFHWEDLQKRLFIDSDVLKTPNPANAQYIRDFFNAIATVEANFTRAVNLFEQHQAAKAKETDVPLAAPRFVYEGDSREEILAAVLRDIQSDYSPLGEILY